MEKLLTLFPAASLRFAEARLAHMSPAGPSPETVNRIIESQQIKEVIQDPSKAPEAARERVEGAIKAHNDRIQHLGDVGATDDTSHVEEVRNSHSNLVAEVRTALQEARQQAAKEAGEKSGKESAETANGVQIDRTNPEYASTRSSDGHSFTWPKDFNDEQLAALHTVRKTMTDQAGQFKPTPEGQPIRGVSVVDQEQNGKVITRDVQGRQVEWRRTDSLSAADFVKLHETVRNPGSATEQVAKKQTAEKLQKQAKEGAQKNAKEAVEAGRLSPKLEELAKAIAELIKVLIEKIKGPGSVRTETGPGRPGEQVNTKVADGANKEVADDLAKLRDKKEAGTEMTDTERQKLREQYEGEKKSNDAAIGKIKDEMPKVVQEEKDLTTSVEQQKKDIAAAKEKNPNDPDIVRMESNLKRTEQTLKEVTDHKGRLEAQQKKLEDRNKVLDSKLKAIEKPKTPQELVKSIQELASKIEGVKVEADLTKTPPSIVVEFKTKAEADTFRTNIKDTLAAAGSSVAVEIKPVA